MPKFGYPTFFAYTVLYYLLHTVLYRQECQDSHWEIFLKLPTLGRCYAVHLKRKIFMGIEPQEAAVKKERVNRGGKSK
jgi:hypothetical protein